MRQMILTSCSRSQGLSSCKLISHCMRLMLGTVNFRSKFLRRLIYPKLKGLTQMRCTRSLSGEPVIFTAPSKMNFCWLNLSSKTFLSYVKNWRKKLINTPQTWPQMKIYARLACYSLRNRLSTSKILHRSSTRDLENRSGKARIALPIRNNLWWKVTKTAKAESQILMKCAAKRKRSERLTSSKITRARRPLTKMADFWPLTVIYFPTPTFRKVNGISTKA